MWYNPFYSIVQFRVTTLRYRPKEAVPIEPNQQRHISTDGVKTTAGATGQPGAPAPKNKKKPKKRRSIIGMIFSFIGCMLCLCIMAASVGGVLLSMYIVQVTADDGETLDLDNQKNRQTSIIYDINGNEYASLSRNENRIWRELSAMPENLQNAVIAIEDKNFRTEPGINLKGTIGAALNAFTGNRIWGTNRGASTLEQQLIKNLTGDNEQDNMRKVREIFRALGLDNKYSKETILEAYLNTIPLTGIVHGMEAGSLEYFGKHVEDLTLSECAVLASITKNPTKYNPATNPEELIKRRNHVLYEMCTQGYITEAEFDAAKAETITLTESSAMAENATRSSSNSWFTDALYNELLTQLQEDLNYTKDEAKELIFSGGLRIYSTVDPKVQEGVEKTMYNEDDLIPALWHEEPVCLRDYPADSSSWDEVQYDDATGLPITKDGYAVYRNTNYVPMGFAYDYYLTQTEYEETAKATRANLLMRALVLTDEDAAVYGKYLTHLPEGRREELYYESYVQDCRERRATAASVFQMNNSGFHAEITLEKENLVFFSVPYDDGFTAYVNGQEADIVEVDEGLMAVLCPAGENSIDFVYQPDGIRLSRALTLGGIVVWLAYTAYFVWRKRRTKRA